MISCRAEGNIRYLGEPWASSNQSSQKPKTNPDPGKGIDQAEQAVDESRVREIHACFGATSGRMMYLNDEGRAVLDIPQDAVIVSFHVTEVVPARFRQMFLDRVQDAAIRKRSTWEGTVYGFKTGGQLSVLLSLVQAGLMGGEDVVMCNVRVRTLTHRPWQDDTRVVPFLKRA